MGFKQITQQPEIDRQIERNIEARKRILARSLSVVGEKVVNKARERGSYTDRTGNLRSSTGYIVVVDGKVIDGKGVSFKAVKDGRQGAAEGKAYAEKLADMFPSGVALVVVAGMKYANYVQKRGYDVTFSAEALASRLLYDLGMPNAKRIEG